MQQSVAEERERIGLALVELPPGALNAIIELGAVQDRTEMPFSSVSLFLGIALMDGAMSWYSSAIAIVPP